MRTGTPAASGLGAALAVAATLLAACGGDDETAQEKPKVPQLASARAINSDPYAIACGHVRNQQKWAETTRRATVAIADRERFAQLNRLQATQSLFFAMTELCKGSPGSDEPARAAVQAVRQGKYRADRGAP
jgi:uncharacterized lipoprotein YajG